MRCHRTFAWTKTTPASPSVGCIGSVCPLWVPEVVVTHLADEPGEPPEVKRGLHVRREVLVGDLGPPQATLLLSESSPPPTGLGACADNLSATPWEDPARLPDGGA